MQILNGLFIFMFHLMSGSINLGWCSGSARRQGQISPWVHVHQTSAGCAHEAWQVRYTAMRQQCFIFTLKNAVCVNNASYYIFIHEESSLSWKTGSTYIVFLTTLSSCLSLTLEITRKVLWAMLAITYSFIRKSLDLCYVFARFVWPVP